mmetsp:Transcript_28555/g.62092  ORF Transcript_28555/g.62092 Transcript_28555/m.62092 type:complete len:392 (-) Transcript_28555:131-1306(-)
MSDHHTEIILGVAGWYITSFGTLLLNKHLLGTLGVQPNTLAVVQMISTAIYGAMKNVNLQVLRELTDSLIALLKGSSDKFFEDLEGGKVRDKELVPRSAWRKGLWQMGLVGAMRFSTVVLGLVSLKHVAASFTETIKASAPFFTVVIAYFMLGERTRFKVVVSLVPVAAGLGLVSCTELSFNFIGFGAAVLTNVIECVQNVFSKRLLASDYTASQLQFYTSLTALVLQAPIFLVTMVDSGPRVPAADAVLNETLDADPELLPHQGLDSFAVFLLWIAGVLYHLQSVVAYVVMSYMSPVTVSVVNTIKRAMAIWVSILFFGNRVTFGAQLGTMTCLLGALWYNWERQRQPSSMSSSTNGSTSRVPVHNNSGNHLAAVFGFSSPKKGLEVAQR